MKELSSLIVGLPLGQEFYPSSRLLLNFLLQTMNAFTFFCIF